MPLIIDGHLDLAWNALSYDRDQTVPVAQLRLREAGLYENGSGRATVSLPEMRRGGVALCFATLLARARPSEARVAAPERTDIDYASQSIACAVAEGQLAYYRLLERQGHVRVIEDVAGLDAHWAEWAEPVAGADQTPPIGLVLAMEGADSVVDPQQAGYWHGLGLRALSLAHYGPSAYAFGTPPRGGPGERIGVTHAGRALLKELDSLGVMLDMSHTSDASFFDAMDLFEGVVFASHTNSRSLVPGPRQFSDEQIKLLVERDGVIGVALEASMLDPAWSGPTDAVSPVPLSAVADHLDHICQLAGDAHHAAIGSDMDGGFGADRCPQGIETIADLGELASLLSSRGFSDNDVAAVMHGNWLATLRRGLPRHARDG